MFIMLIVCICGNNFARLPLGSRLAHAWLTLGSRLASARLPLDPRFAGGGAPLGGRSPHERSRGGTKWSRGGARGRSPMRSPVSHDEAERSVDKSWRRAERENTEQLVWFLYEGRSCFLICECSKKKS